MTTIKAGDELRAAAKLMRERASLVPPPPWHLHRTQITTDDGANVIADSGLPERSRYVASWHPGVALAVAEWLEAEAADAEVFPLRFPQALAVARAYLGGQIEALAEVAGTFTEES